MPSPSARDVNKIVNIDGIRYIRGLRPLTCLIIACAFCASALACDSDAECGPGGTCIKREKRARGVCYGGRGNAQTDATPADQTPERNRALPQAMAPESNSQSGDAPIFGEEGYVEPSASPGIIDRLELPERTSGACITSTDCAGGQECVYRDPMLGHGTCEMPPN